MHFCLRKFQPPSIISKIERIFRMSKNPQIRVRRFTKNVHFQNEDAFPRSNWAEPQFQTLFRQRVDKKPELARHRT